MRKIYLSFVAAMIVLTGCNKNTTLSDADEERNQFVSNGQALMEQGDYAGAIDAFKQAITTQPGIARPHLDLAVIYQQYQIDYVHSIYHYDRYLELRPDTEKKTMIEEQKLNVAKALANLMINNSTAVQKLVKNNKDLSSQNAELKRQLVVALQTQKTAATSAPGSTQTATQTIPKSATPETQAPTAQTPAPEPSGYQIYHVVGGDTLTKISTKFYNDPGKWDIIYEANKDRLRRPEDLKPGQTLVIPNIFTQ